MTAAEFWSLAHRIARSYSRRSFALLIARKNHERFCWIHVAHDERHCGCGLGRRVFCDGQLFVRTNLIYRWKPNNSLVNGVLVLASLRLLLVYDGVMATSNV